ncbi:TetR/AcrR family transcriptional regulator [Streptomyces albus]|uniref:TetR/AcrR family transcriptional regulator n=1 Tax=Streptomyces albus TaxID=1888 RepID=UPI0004C83AEF|nr:TetR/AcrR family transcriptional regulator [Streptomyces albus]
MPTARESLLDAALAALSGRPWPGVRMVDVAVAARVSRQTLYNEFGSKDGLARALVRREVDRYLAGVRHALAGPPPGEPGERLVAVADWTARTARHNPLVRAALTGCWGERLPRPPRTAAVQQSGGYVPAQRRADGPLPSPSELVAQIRDLAAAALAPGRPPEEVQRMAGVCEIAVRLALSCVVAPAGERETGPLIRRALRGGGGL